MLYHYHSDGNDKVLKSTSVPKHYIWIFSGTFNVLSEAHGRGDRLALAVVALLLEDVVVAGQVVQTQLFPPLLLLVSGRKLLGKGEHGEDDQQHGHGTQQEPTPPADGRGGVDAEYDSRNDQTQINSQTGLVLSLYIIIVHDT